MPALLAESSITASPARRVVLQEWELSRVERLYLDDGTSVIVKTACPPFTAEADALWHAHDHWVPVPRLLGSSRLPDGRAVMVLEDLGELPARQPSMAEGVAAALHVHGCPPLGALPVVELAELPGRAMECLDSLQDAGRWGEAAEVRLLLEQLDDAVPYRARGADTPPYGMVHGDFHPASLHNGGPEVKIFDWGRACTGPGLLDLASWQDTAKPLEIWLIAAMIEVYAARGGVREALAPRGGLPAEVWAGGWHRVWISEWYLQQALRWMPDPCQDEMVERVVLRHLREARLCLRPD